MGYNPFILATLETPLFLNSLYIKEQIIHDSKSHQRFRNLSSYFFSQLLNASKIHLHFISHNNFCYKYIFLFHINYLLCTIYHNIFHMSTNLK